jgi:hypothetical protein
LREQINKLPGQGGFHTERNNFNDNNNHNMRNKKMLIPITIGTSDSLANSQPMLLPSQEYNRSQATSAER